VLNDRSSLLSLLQTRRSAKPRALQGNGPSAGELEEILAIAARTPDHGKLAPWRFVVVADRQRDALARLLHDAVSQEVHGATAAHHRKEDEFAHYGGILVVLVSAPVPDHKIPVWEQELSCGAAGMNLLTAATALGFDAGWVTGWRAYSPRFAGPASGLRASSSSASRRSSSKNGRGPSPETSSAGGNRGISLTKPRGAVV
jgi:nitroreductase